MTTPLWVANVASWWLQTWVLVVVGGAAATLLLPSAAQLRLRLFQGLLLMAALLPFVEPWKALPAPRAAPASLLPLRELAVEGDRSPLAPAAASAEAAGFGWPALLLVVLIAGTVLRLAWLGLGLVRLRRWRGQGERLLAEGISPGITIRLVDGLHSPASFGWSSPVILIPLPDSLPVAGWQTPRLRHPT